MTKRNAINWFELYVTDFDRARTFYETILKTSLEPAEMEGCQMGLFPCGEEGQVGGAITRMEGFDPGRGGTIVYLNVEGDLDGVLERIPAAGGEVVKGRLPIPPHGFIGIFKDPEGNIVGLHSMT